jgi:RNA polymerase sigma factor FliA
MSTPSALSAKTVSPEELWQQYQTTRDARLRDRLILTFSPMVKFIVYRKLRELPAHCDVEDFLSCGLEALITCIDRYDPSKGATLQQYAWTRIYGAVLDELRRLDWAPRSLRRWERDIEQARDEYTAATGRPPSHEQLAAAMGVAPEELRRRQHEIGAATTTSLNAVMTVGVDDGEGVERVDTIASEDERLDPERAAALTEAKDRFREAFRTLSQRERELVVLMYVKNLTLREVGDVLGVSESRACQIHTEIKKKMRVSLADHGGLMQAVA